MHDDSITQTCSGTPTIKSRYILYASSCRYTESISVQISSETNTKVQPRRPQSALNTIAIINDTGKAQTNDSQAFGVPAVSSVAKITVAIAQTQTTDSSEIAILLPICKFLNRFFFAEFLSSFSKNAVSGTPYNSLNELSVSISGVTSPVSHRDTALSE